MIENETIREKITGDKATGEGNAEEEPETSRKEQRSEAKELHSEYKTSVSENPAQEESSDEFRDKRFPVVGIGASAGGLAAFKAFFSAIHADQKPDMAFVLVQHLDPNRKSFLKELLEHYTNMPVYEVEDGTAVRPGSVYIIPPNRDMSIQEGRLLLREPVEPHGRRMPIDIFFRSLAQDKKEVSVGIVLSGTGSDGTQGVRAIKAEGGMVMVQSPESSEYDGMPLSVIATGLADYVLDPMDMPSQLTAYVTQAFERGVKDVSRAEDSMKKIFNLLLVQKGHDFSHYKHSTVSRRIERRMAVHNLEKLEEYVRFLEQNPSEAESLFFDLLIGVTSFFRNPEAFELLDEKVIPILLSSKEAGSGIRVWVPGCSTGEEAYSIAILFHEHMERVKQVFRVQIFATDIDNRAISMARSCTYPSSISNDISPERLERFFIRSQDGSYHIQKAIRDMIVFSEQDLLKDPPFSRLDLISCRNVLIYMDRELQSKLIPIFHYALNPGGFLFLGPSETVGDFDKFFDTFDRKSKVYRTRGDLRSEYLSIGPFASPMMENMEVPRPQGRVSGVRKNRLHELVRQVLLEHYAPASALINEQGEILYVHGRTGMYLEPAPGEASFNILKMSREGLKQELISDLHRAVVYKKPIFHPELKVKTNGSFCLVNLVVRPLIADNDTEKGPDLFLVTFEKPSEEGPEKVGKGEMDAEDSEVPEKPKEVETRILALKQELKTKEERLRASKEELEASYEELKSSNEEMQSVNEELQSTNEELETSKEELQSVNEELATVNAELQNKVAELSQANNDMNNLLSGTGIGTIFVNHQLRIMRFTPAVTQVINLIPTDVGRPVGHIVSNLPGYNRLVEDIKEVLDNLSSKDIEVQTSEGAWYLMRIRPYRTLENVIEGVVITFTEITEMKKAREILKESVEAMRRLSALLHDSRDAISLQDMKGNILAWNPGAEKMYGWSEAEALKMNINAMIPDDWKDREMSIMNKLSRAETLEPYRTQRLTREGKLIDISLTATPLVNEEGEVYAIATTERKIKSEKEENKSEK